MAAHAAEDEWTAAMRRGDLETAWSIKDAELRHRSRERAVYWQYLPRHLQSVWSGQPLAGKRVLVRCYHGLGDTIQFIRFLQPLREVAHSVSLWVQPALLELSRTAQGVDAALPLHDGTPDIDHDADVELMELPHALRITSIPANIPYLFQPNLFQPKATKIEKSRNTFSVGLIWQAGNWDPRRSIPDRLIGRLVGINGIRLYSLQHPRPRDSIPFPDISRAHICACAAEMLALDLVVTVDTMAAHLAGALGCRTWTLLHKECDWRWPLDGRVTSWYPKMRLLHQQRSGDWDSVIEELYLALQEESETHRGSQV